MKEQGIRENEGKLKWSLVDFKALEPMVKVLEYGMDKYSAHNWKKGLPVTEISESLIRHLISFLSGEDIDGESGLPHVGHIACNAMFLSHMALFRSDMDDRYQPIWENIDDKVKELEGMIGGKKIKSIAKALREFGNGQI